MEKISLAFKKTPVLDHFDACFEEGKITALIGPSGCGKTSLIRIMAGLLRPGAGEALVGGEPVRGVRRGTAVVFQDYGLLPWKTVRANAELPLRLAGVKGGPVEALLEEFGLSPFARCYPRELSGGMKQRLAVVRALAAEPDLLLMDEPFSSLDALTREEAQDFLLQTMHRRRLTVVLVTHAIEEAVYLADTVWVMTGRNPGLARARLPILREAGERAAFRGTPLFMGYCNELRRLLKR